MSLLGKLFRRALVLLGILIVAAIAVPSFLRARVNSNEAAAIADTRRVQDAEQAYASANGGLFDDVSRLCKEGPDCLGIGGDDGLRDRRSDGLGRDPRAPFARSISVTRRSRSIEEEEAFVEGRGA